MLGPSTDKDKPPAPAPLVDIVKLQCSPLLPDVNPGPYAVTVPVDNESTWNLYGEPVNLYAQFSTKLEITQFNF